MLFVKRLVMVIRKNDHDHKISKTRTGESPASRFSN